MKTNYFLLFLCINCLIVFSIQAQHYHGYDPELSSQPEQMLDLIDFQANESIIPVAAQYQYNIHCLTAVFKNTSLNAAAFLWHFGIGDSTNNQEHPSYTYPEAGDYEVTLIAISDKGSRDTVTKVIQVYNCYPVGVTNQQPAFKEHRIYPNPSHQQLTFDWQVLDIFNSYTLQIFNIKGQKILQELDISQSTTTIDIAALRAGTYYYTLTNQQNKRLLSGRFIKQ